MQLLVAKKVVEIDPRLSGFHLKTLVGGGRLYFAGRELLDDVSLDVQGVREGSRIAQYQGLKGGTSYITVFFWVALLLYALLICLLMVTGIFNLIAYLYGFLSQDALQALYQWMFDYKWVAMIAGPLIVFLLTTLGVLVLGVSTGTAAGVGAFVMVFTVAAIAMGYMACLRVPFRIAINALDFLIKHTVVFLFVYVAFTTLGYPFFGASTQDHCQAVYTSKKLALIGALVYVVIYGLLNLPNFLAGVATDLTSLTTPTQTFVTPAILATRDTIDFTKYFPYYFIPIVGPSIQFMHQIMGEVVTSAYEGANNIKMFKGNVKGMLAQLMINAGVKEVQTDQCQPLLNKIPTKAPVLNAHQARAVASLTQTVKTYGLEQLVAYAWMGTDDQMVNCLYQEYEAGSIFTKLGLTGKGRQYIMALLANKAINATEYTATGTSDYFNYIGDNVNVVVDTVKMGSIAGLGTLSLMIILFIITYLWPGFLNYL